MALFKNFFCLKFSLALTFVQICLFANAQYNFTAVDKFLAVNQKALGNEVVVLISKEGKLVYRKELGELSFKTPVPIASCSKWLTAALVMTYVDEGKLSLEDKVSDYLPIFATYGKKYITIRQCLSHQTGIADNGTIIGKIFARKKYASLEEEVNSFAKREIATNAGSAFFYGGVGLNIAGRILEVITKKKFEVLMKQRLFVPLNMKNSSFTTEEDDAINPSGSASTSASDYMNFLNMLANNGTHLGKRILSEKAVAIMQASQTTGIPKIYAPKTAEGYDYGLGAWIVDTDGTGKTAVVASPGLFGTWPYIDLCRGYSAIIFVKSLLSEQKKTLYVAFKKLVDEQMPSNCN